MGIIFLDVRRLSLLPNFWQDPARSQESGNGGWSIRDQRPYHENKRRRRRRRRRRHCRR